MQESALALLASRLWQLSNLPMYGMVVLHHSTEIYGRDAWLHSRGSRTCPGTDVPCFKSVSPGMACMGARDMHHAMIDAVTRQGARWWRKYLLACLYVEDRRPQDNRQPRGVCCLHCGIPREELGEQHTKSSGGSVSWIHPDKFNALNPIWRGCNPSPRDAIE